MSNENKLSPVTVYVPVSVISNPPATFTSFHTITENGYVSHGVYNGDGFSDKSPVWLKEQERFLFTKEELEILLDNTFQAGCDYADDFSRHMEYGDEISEPDNSSYIQSLF